ncbi:fumarylacetoacetate hydrolase family protein [Microbacterium sp. G2-8]|uniref:fumarylacetoacetate hydrolase family protein n=1 Tax=Microbacterium sp. G2-8 TaxID=2842454 RepID=UPI001C8AE304|nr:fumarylacetoacetate hydrolase family protein [Microbacterium sp. G2-8]
MRIARFSHNDAIKYGIVDDAELVVLEGDPMLAGFDTTGERISIRDVALLTPVIPRSKVVCVGRNYRDHAAEFGNDVPKEPLLFFKPNTSVIGPGDAIVRPPQSADTQWEGELAVVVGRIAKNVKAADAHSVVFGYTVANDVTARDLQAADGQWARAKGMDTFCPIGPAIETDFDVAAGEVITRLNGEEKQRGSFRDMIFDIPAIIEYVSAAFTLLPGDIILTGTPAGVGPFAAGDVVEVEVPGIGILRNPVRDAG